MNQIILVRHGETEWNAGEIIRGRADVALNENGLKQAELLAGYLADFAIEAVYASPLQRTLKTAAAIAARHGLEVRSEPGLIDLSFGEWEGKPLEEVQEDYPELYRQWVKAPEKVMMPSGESLNDVRRRTLKLVNDVIARHQGTVVLVSHRVVNKVLICVLLGLDNSHFWNIRIDTCGITTFNYENSQFILIEHNNTSFLKPLNMGKLKDF
jgi:broad specificity phosphatase PhoE